MRRLRGLLAMSVAAGLAGCAQPSFPPPRVVATIPEPEPAPPVMPYGGYPTLEIPKKRTDGTYVTPNFELTDAAAVWHLRGALNVAALACDNAGGGVLDGYNSFLTGHRAALDTWLKQYLYEWEKTDWSDWRDAYEANQTRLYNFYSQSTLRVAFCGVAREEMPALAMVTDGDLPRYSRAALARLDKPFIDFFTKFDAWRDYYQPNTPPPKFVPTVSTTSPIDAAPPTANAASPDPSR